MRVMGVTSMNWPRIQLPMPSGPAMCSSKRPPAWASIVQSGTVNGSGANQRARCSAAVQALNTVCGGACTTRESFSGGKVAASLVISVVPLITVSFLFQRLQVVVQPVEAVLPLGPAGVDPLLGLAERLGRDRAGAHPADLLAAHEAGGFQHAQVLHRGWQRHRQ